MQLHPSHDQAEASLELLGRIRCGRKCKGLHRLANLAAEGFDIEEQPSAGCAAWCLAQVEQAPRVVVWNHWRGRVPVGFGLPNGQELTREQVQAIGLIDARAGNCVGSEIRPGWGQLRTYPELASRAAEEVAAIIGAEIVSSTASASR